LGTLVAAAAVGFVVLLLNNTYGFIPIKNTETNNIVQEIKTINATSINREKTVVKLEELSTS